MLIKNSVHNLFSLHETLIIHFVKITVALS